MSNKERDIITALNEAKKMEEEEKLKAAAAAPEDKRKSEDNTKHPAKNSKDGLELNDCEDVTEGYDYLYTCPDCGEVFVLDDGDVTECTCPECGADIKPKFEGKIEDADDNDFDADECDTPKKKESCKKEDYEVTYKDVDGIYRREEMELDSDNPLEEAKKKVVGGKVVKAQKTKKGYKRVNGKLVKMSSKEKKARQKAIKKAQRKAQSGSAKKSRAKSMKVRSKKKMNSSLDLDVEFNENSFIQLMNGAIEDLFHNLDEGLSDKDYEPFEITAVEAFQSPDDPSYLVVEAEIRYEGGDTDTARFVVEGLQSMSDVVSVTETSGALDLDGLTFNGLCSSNEEYDIDMSEITYSLRSDESYVTETFMISED